MLFIKMKYKKKLLFLFILFVFANKIFADDYSSVQQNINSQYQQQQRDIELKARQTPIADEEQIFFIFLQIANKNTQPCQKTSTIKE